MTVLIIRKNHLSVKHDDSSLERELQSANCSLIPPSVLSYILSKIRQTSTIHPSHLSAKDDDSSFNTECFFLFSQKGSRCIPLLL